VPSAAPRFGHEFPRSIAKDYNLFMVGSSSSRSHNAFRSFLMAALLLSGLVTALHAQDTVKRGRKYKAPPPTSAVEITVLRDTNGKPVENASVIFHPLENGHDNGNMELKTNEDGKAKLDLLPIGSSVRLQVIAPGFQTFGEDYKVDKDTLNIEVKLKRPTAQYSIYKKSEGAKSPAAGDKVTGTVSDTETPKPAPDTAPPASPEPQKESAAPDAPKQDAPKQDAPKPDATPSDAKPQGAARRN
jgi:hypothetical protein